MIPKIIFYAWFGKGEYPTSLKKSLESWKSKNPDYEIKEINESSFDVNEFDFTKKAYALKKWAFVSDVARIWAINTYGGIYVDVDVIALKSFNDLNLNRQFWAKEDAGSVNSGLIFGSVRNDCILTEILQYYENLEFDDNNLRNISTVNIISKILKKYGLKNNKKFNYLSNKAVVFPPEFFAPFHYWGGGKVTENTITVHYYNSSWTKLKKTKFKYIMHQIMYYVPLFGVMIRCAKEKRLKFH